MRPFMTHSPQELPPVLPHGFKFTQDRITQPIKRQNVRLAIFKCPYRKPVEFRRNLTHLAQ